MEQRACQVILPRVSSIDIVHADHIHDAKLKVGRVLGVKQSTHLRSSLLIHRCTQATTTLDVDAFLGKLTTPRPSRFANLTKELRISIPNLPFLTNGVADGFFTFMNGLRYTIVGKKSVLIATQPFTRRELTNESTSAILLD